MLPGKHMCNNMKALHIGGKRKKKKLHLFCFIYGLAESIA